MSPSPRLEPTHRRSLLWAMLVGAAVAYVTLATLEALELVAPEVPWSTPALLALAALAGAGFARVTWVRNRSPQHRPEPRQAVATLALARAMMLAGAAFTGGYLAIAVYFVPRWDAPSPRSRVVHGLVAVAASVALTAAGWALEYACQVPRNDDDDDPSPDADD